MLTAQRAVAFSQRFPQYAPLVVHNNRLYGCWLVGALCRRRIGYYGEFPYSVKERILALFPDCPKVLYLCSGVVADPGAWTYDINADLKPTICDDVRNVLQHRELLSSVDLVIADPPYEAKDFAKYGQRPFNKAQVLRDLGQSVRPGCNLAYLDLIVPIYNKKVWRLLGHIGLVVSTNTRMRLLSLFQREDAGEGSPPPPAPDMGKAAPGA